MDMLVTDREEQKENWVTDKIYAAVGASSGRPYTGFIIGKYPEPDCIEYVMYSTTRGEVLVVGVRELTPLDEVLL